MRTFIWNISSSGVLFNFTHTRNLEEVKTSIDDLVKNQKESEIAEVHIQVTRDGNFDWHLYLNTLRPMIRDFMGEYPLHSEQYEHLLKIYDPLAWDVEELQYDGTELYLGD